MARVVWRRWLTLVTMVVTGFGVGASAGAQVIDAKQYDVIVYGGTASGVVAATGAAREKASVLLLEPGKHLGGMVSGGLGATDVGIRSTIGGIALEYFTRLGDHYGEKGPVWRHEPHVAEQTFDAMLKEAGVTVQFGQRLRERDGVTKDGHRIVAITTEVGQVYRGMTFIDATYEGDLMAQAGVAYTVGREGVDQYNESKAGVRKANPFGYPGIARDDKGLLPDILPEPPAVEGSADKKIMSYTYRLCLTRDPANRLPIAKPDNYDPRRYALALPTFRDKPDIALKDFLTMSALPNGKFDANNRFGVMVSLNLHNGSWGYPDGTYVDRDKIRREHEQYVAGFLYFLANDPNVPERVRKEAAEIGLAADEFKDSKGWPHQLYVRVGRRMVGQYVITQNDLEQSTTQADPIAMGSYFMDSHRVQRYALPNGDVAWEGGVGGKVPPYQISYRTLTPKREQCENLLVTVCMSTTSVAWCSIRMEPVLMMMGHSAGVAAALAATDRSAVQDVSYAVLGPKLIAQKQIFEYTAPKQPTKQEAGPEAAVPVADDEPVVMLAAAKVPPTATDAEAGKAIVVDDADMQFVGKWVPASHAEALNGQRFSHDDNKNKGKSLARFVPQIPADGLYAVSLTWIANKARASSVPVVIRSADGEQHFRLKQSTDDIGAKTQLVATVHFKAGTDGWVVVSNEGTDDYVAIDAVRFEPADAAVSTGLSPVAAPSKAIDYNTLPWRTRLIGMKGQPDVADVGDPAFPCITPYGQWMHRQWPQKINTDADLAARRAEEASDLAAHAGPAQWNQYGGCANGPQLESTGYFRTQKHEGRWWFVDPDGRLFFSNGVNCVRKMDPTPIDRREDWFAGQPWTRPEFAPFVITNVRAAKYDYAGTTPRSFNFMWANLQRKYGPDWDAVSGELAHRRLRSWGFNTIGNWSNEGMCLQRKTPYIVNLGATGTPLKGSTRGPFRDVFDDVFATNLAERVKQEAGKSLNDPWCLGYFVDNELSWGDAHTLGQATLQSPADQPAKLAMVDELKHKYVTIDALNAAWETKHVSWDDLLAAMRAPTTAAGKADMVAFHRTFADRYFKTVRDVLKKEAPNQLYFGCRIHMPNTAAIESAAKYCDVVSLNMYRPGLQLADAKLDAPMMVTEFGVGAVDRGHFYGGVYAVDTQADRVAYYNDYLSSVIRHPNMVGAHWFQFSDQPISGRTLEGENGQYGLIDIADTPYAEMIGAARENAATLYQRLSGAGK